MMTASKPAEPDAETRDWINAVRARRDVLARAAARLVELGDATLAAELSERWWVKPPTSN